MQFYFIQKFTQIYQNTIAWLTFKSQLAFFAEFKSPQQNLKSMAEIFSITEIFSTFYEKVTNKRKDKAQLLLRLAEFKENIYQNSNNLEECYSFFETNKMEKNVKKPLKEVEVGHTAKNRDQG